MPANFPNYAATVGRSVDSVSVVTLYTAFHSAMEQGKLVQALHTYINNTEGLWPSCIECGCEASLPVGLFKVCAKKPS